MTATMHIPKNSIRPLELFSIILSTYLCLLTLATICTKNKSFLSKLRRKKQSNTTESKLCGIGFPFTTND